MTVPVVRCVVCHCTRRRRAPLPREASEPVLRARRARRTPQPGRHHQRDEQQNAVNHGNGSRGLPHNFIISVAGGKCHKAELDKRLFSGTA